MKKSALTYEWINIHTKNGITYQRRQRKKVRQNEQTTLASKEERLKEWKTRDSFAGLKDALANSIKYNGNYYDHYGNQIYVPPAFVDIIDEIHNSKNNVNTFSNFVSKDKTDIEKKSKNKLIGLIKLKDKIFQQEYAKKVKFFDETQNNPVIIKRNIASFLNTIHEKRSSVTDMLYALQYVRNRIVDHIDPTILVTYEGKTQEKTLDELIERLKKAKETKGAVTSNTGIQKLEFVHLNEYDDEDFANQKYKMTATDHTDIVNRVNKHMAKIALNNAKEKS